MAQRGNVDYGQIRQTARKGAGSQVQMFGGGLTTAGHVAVYNGAGDLVDGGAAAGGAGTVTSVALTMPPEFAVAGSPIVNNGTLAVSKASQSPNLVWASPASGSGAPVFRALVAADIPAGIGGNQTPWLQPVDANGFALSNIPSITGQSSLALASNGAAPLTLSTNAKTRFSIDSAGHVAINAPDDTGAALIINTANVAGAEVTAPLTLFRTYGDVGDGQDIRFAGGGGKNAGIIRSYANAAGESGLAFYTQTAAGDAVSHCSAVILGNGNVGIGTTTPRSALSVIAGNPNTVAAANQITICEGSNNPAYGFQLGFVLLNSTWSGLLQSTNNSVGSPLFLNPNGGNVNVGGTKPIGALTVIPVGGTPGSATAATQLWIGEGTNNAQYGLQLGYFNSASAGWPGVLQVWAGGGASALLLQPQGGNVGIGISTFGPQASLSCGPTLGMKLAAYDNGSTQVYGIGIQNNLMQLIVPASSSRIGFGYGTTAAFNEVMSITNGQVGIGNTGPVGGSILDVNGNQTSRGWLSLGTPATPAAGTLLNITTTNATTPAGAIHLSINEQTANPSYGLKLGFYLVPGVQYNGCIQVYSGAPGSTLLLQPNGGNVAVGKSTAAYTLDVTGDVNCTGAHRVNGAPIVPLNFQYAVTNTLLSLINGWQTIPAFTITIPAAGTYVIEVMCLMYSTGSSSGMQIYVNGAAPGGSFYQAAAGVNFPSVPAGQDYWVPAIWKAPRACAAGDKITVGVAGGASGVGYFRYGYMTAMQYA